MALKEISPEKAWEALEGTEDTLTPQVLEQLKRQRTECSICGGPLKRTLDPNSPFLDGLPHYRDTCELCNL